MKELSEMTLAELKALEAQIKVAKANAKESEKASKANVEQSAIDSCNKAISDRTLTKGADVIVLYKGKELTVKVATEPSVDRPTINCSSLDFDGKESNGEKRRYVEKRFFVSLAG